MKLYLGDCLDILPTIPDASVDCVITDPPYGLSFMGKDWDHGVPGVPFWEAALRVAKPGVMLLAFGGTRTHHRLMVAIEDAGWEIRDCLMWLYGSGFPKSMDIGKAIDKAAGAEREVAGLTRGGVERGGKFGDSHLAESEKWHNVTAPATDAAKQWDGWGTALKPAWEPIIMARKPLIGTVANNVLAHGAGGINVDACRIPTTDSLGGGMVSMGRPKSSEGWDRPWMHDPQVTERKKAESAEKVRLAEVQGRWPANLVLDEDAAAILDAQSGLSKSTNRPRHNSRTIGGDGIFNGGTAMVTNGHSDTGGASRFFYVAKASKRDRDEGNHHPTVKPTQLMRYLVRLVTPPNGVVLDPFMGSGSTGKAAILEGFRFTGIELDPDYFAIAQRRIANVQAQLALIGTN